MLRYQTTTGRRAPLPAGTTVAWPEASGLAAMHERRVTRGTDHVDGPDGARLEVAQAKVSQPVGLRVRPGLHGEIGTGLVTRAVPGLSVALASRTTTTAVTTPLPPGPVPRPHRHRARRVGDGDPHHLPDSL